MLAYHGTIREYAKGIQANGLTPNHKAFQVNSIPLPRKGCTYVALSRWYAEQFARFRAQYATAAPCESWEIDAGWQTVTMKKRCDAPPSTRDIDLTPVVITFDLPETVKTQGDKDSMVEKDNVIVKGTIPAKYIKSIEPLE